MKSFTHLHTHSMYSFSDGMSKVPDLVEQALAFGMPAIALTDHGGMYGIMELFSYCAQVNARRQAVGESTILPIAGCEVYVSSKQYHLVLLAKNLQGYRNLCKISSAGYLRDDFRYKPIVEWNTIEQYHDGLICLSACIGGELVQTILHGGAADEVVLRHKALFADDYYIELQRHKTDKPNACTETYTLQQQIEPTLLSLAKKYDIPLVATNDSHFLREEDAEAHDALLQFHYGRSNKSALHFSKQEWFKSQEEMAAVFADIPEALYTTQAVVNKIETYTISTAIPQLPAFPLPCDFDTAAEYLQYLAFDGAHKRLPPSVLKEAVPRIRRELDVFTAKGAANYLLMVWDICRACSEELYVLTGTGRGYASGSLVLYCLGITDVNPLQYDLHFERFYNMQSSGLPSIDIDIAASGRQKVVDYIRHKYGERAVCHIITHLSWSKSRSPYPQLEGLSRQRGVHVNGIVIAPGNITDYVPVAKVTTYPSRETTIVTQYDRRGIAAAGLVQINLLGLEALDIQNEMCNNILLEERGGNIDFASIPLDDVPTLRCFLQNDSNAPLIAGFEELTPWLQRIEHLTFNDLVVLYTMHRPGLKSYLSRYVRRRNAEEPTPSLLAGAIDALLAETCGIILFEEQVMTIGQQVAGLSREESNLLRKAISKRNVRTLADMHDKFIAGCIKNSLDRSTTGMGNSSGVPKGSYISSIDRSTPGMVDSSMDSSTAECLWQFLVKYGMYAFSKSHAVAMTLLHYRTLYLKTHYSHIYQQVCKAKGV